MKMTLIKSQLARGLFFSFFCGKQCKRMGNNAGGLYSKAERDTNFRKQFNLTYVK